MDQYKILIKRLTEEALMKSTSKAVSEEQLKEEINKKIGDLFGNPLGVKFK